MLANTLYRVVKGKNSPFNIVLNEDGHIVSSEGVTRCDLNFKQVGVSGLVISSSVDSSWFTLEHPVIYEGVATEAVRVDLKNTSLNPGRYEVDVFVWDVVSTEGRFAGTIPVQIEGPLSAPIGALPMSLFGNPQLPALTPAQITANQNNYGPGTEAWWRLSSDASRNITGMAFIADGVYRVLTNVGSFNIVIQHQHVDSAAANRYITRLGKDLIIEPSASALFQYDGVSDRWREIESKIPPHYLITPAEGAAPVTIVDSAYPPDDVRRVGAVGDGSTDDRAAFAAQDSVDSVVNVLGQALTYRIATSLTLTSPLYIAPGCMISVDAAQTLTLNGHLMCNYGDWSQKFTGSGSVVLTKSQEVFADWFGPVSVTLASPNDTVQKAITATARGSVIRFKGRYASTPLDLIFDEGNQATATNRDAGKSLLGIGNSIPFRFGTQSVALGAEIILGDSQNDDLFSFTGVRFGGQPSRSNVWIDGVGFNANKAGNASGSCLYFASVKDIHGGTLFTSSASEVGVEFDPDAGDSTNVCNFNTVFAVDHDGDGVQQGGLGDPQWGTLHVGGNGGDGCVIGNGFQIRQIHSYVNGEKGVVVVGPCAVGDIRVNNSDDCNVQLAATVRGARIATIRSHSAALAPASDPVDAHVAIGSTSVGVTIGSLHCDDTTAQYSGTHNGADNVAVLSDSTANFGAVNGLIGQTVKNTTDGSSGIVTANTATTITATLAGGTQNDWDAGDAYTVSDAAKRCVYIANGASGNVIAAFSHEGTPTGQIVFVETGAEDDGNSIIPAAAVASVAYAASITPDPYAARQLNFAQLTGALSLTNFPVNHLCDGHEITTRFTADGTNRVITWNARWDHDDGATTTVLANTTRLMKWVAKGNIFELASDQAL